ncbi:VanZ family protein [Paenibacillus medicaginis]|uniref:VanZ family protein n=1 Tax=Paenibacillus medicaginis TaxID=1470560 RepID=A0ABV5C5J9_9BACL
MLKFYLFPISYAFMTFPIAALLFTLPFLIVQYRRHGYIHKTRAFMLYLFLLYLMNIFYLILLPFPETRHNTPLADGNVQLVPLHFIQDIIRETKVVADEPSSYWHLLRERAFLQVAFNVALTVPFGMFLRYYFRTGWIVCLSLSLLLSLTFEGVQLSATLGYYDNPYRVADVDDLIANTLGGITGFLLAGWPAAHLPRMDRLDEKVDLSVKRISYTRRAVAWLIDLGVWLLIYALLMIYHTEAAYWVSSGIYFMLIPFLTGGRTLGKWTVRIKLTGKRGRVSLAALIIRYGILYWVIGGIGIWLPILSLRVSDLSFIMTAFVVFIVMAAFVVHIVTRIVNKDPLLFYEKLSKTSHVITWPDKHRDNKSLQTTSM